MVLANNTLFSTLLIGGRIAHYSVKHDYCLILLIQSFIYFFHPQFTEIREVFVIREEMWEAHKKAGDLPHFREK